MIDYLKQKLYFVASSYFKLWAEIQLRKWNPRIFVITGSSGKTTLMHFVESQLKGIAKISHHANSAIGIPFDILNITRATLKPSEWPLMILTAPFKAFAPSPQEKIYIVECDCDRPLEGKFLAEFLKPEGTLWISLSRTHSVNFDELVSNGTFKKVEDAIAHEFGYFIEHASKLAIINGDSQEMKNQLSRTQAKAVEVSENEYLQKYECSQHGTDYIIQNNKYHFDELHPKEIFYSIAMTKALIEYLDLPFDPTFKNFEAPVGRSTIFEGIKNTTIIDSSYNANYISMKAILEMTKNLNAENKWIILGDMRELGEEEKEEHERLGELINSMNFQKVLLLGPAIIKYTFPVIVDDVKTHNKLTTILKFANHKELQSYLNEEIKGNELLIFKASQSLVFEGFIETLLKNKNDIQKLPRREIAWDSYRANKGF